MKRAPCCVRRDIHLAEWIYEAGIGENRAILVESGAILEAQIEREGPGARVGAVLNARLLRTVAEHVAPAIGWVPAFGRANTAS